MDYTWMGDWRVVGFCEGLTALPSGEWLFSIFSSVISVQTQLQSAGFFRDARRAHPSSPSRLVFANCVVSDLGVWTYENLERQKLEKIWKRKIEKDSFSGCFFFIFLLKSTSWQDLRTFGCIFCVAKKVIGWNVIHCFLFIYSILQ